MSGRTGSPPLRVLLVDDSQTVRAVLRRLLRRDVGLEVVGEAADGLAAVEQVRELAPDVVVMDVEMPLLDGWAATERIMEIRPTAVLVLSSRVDRDQQQSAFRALRSGALDVLAKPVDPAGWELLHETLPELLRAAVTRGREAVAQPRVPASALVQASPNALPRVSLNALLPRAGLRYVAIGASTGGPLAVREVLAALPATLPATVLVVQHIAVGFEEAMVEWLVRDLGRDVRLAQDGEEARSGAVRFAPAGAHLRLGADGVLRLDRRTPPRRGHRPSADELFFSCVRAAPSRTAGLLLSGMGSDGAEGLLALRQAGGLTAVQDAASCAVFGMPRAALERGAAETALPPGELGRLLARSWETLPPPPLARGTGANP